MEKEQLTYNLDIEKGSLWLRSTPSEFALSQPYYCSEAGIFYAKSNFCTSRVYKNRYILFYTFSGCGQIEQNGTTIELNKGEAVLIDCRTPQKYGTLGNHWHHYWLHIDGKGIDVLHNILIGTKFNIVCLPESSVRSCFDPIIRNLEKAHTETVLQDSLLIHQLLNLMVQECFASVTSDNSVKALILKSADYIQAHYASDLDFNKLQKEAHMSRSYYMRMFRRYIGTTPYSYQLSMRITKAKELLELTDDPIHEIAEKLGFSSHASFTVRFTAMASESPQEYRNNAMKRNDS